jgi:hypothetical protein
VITKDLAIICISRRRAATLPHATLRLFPEATVCVAKSERADYAKVTSRLLLHPDEVTGLGPLKSWVIATVSKKSRVTFIVADDLSKCYSLAGALAQQVWDPEVLVQLVANTAACAAAAGARIFGFNQAWDVRKYRPMSPFVLASWVGGAMGFVGDDVRYDSRLLLRADVDACLDSLLRHRIIWQDTRYAFEQKRWAGGGGNAPHRSAAQHERELALLRQKWQGHLSVRQTKAAVRLIIHVDRRQPQAD